MAANVAECEDCLTRANPALVCCFEEVENNFSMERNPDGSGTQGGEMKPSQMMMNHFHVSEN